MINGSSRRDLLLDSQNFCRSIPAGAENPSLSRLCYRRIWGSRNRRALILGWAYYLDAFSSYPLRTWLPSVYRGHDNWYTRGAGSPHLHRHVYFTEPLSETVPRSLRLSSPTSLTFRHWAGVSPHTWSYDFAETCVFGKQSPGPGHCDPLCTLFVEGRSSFSWEYGMGYFSAVAPGPDSPPVDEPCGGTLRFSGHWILTNVCVTQADSLASASSTPARANASLSGGTLPYRCIFTSHSFGRSLSPVHLRRKSARSVSYYALFQGWLLLGKPPGCLCTPTSFITERSFRGLSW
ncbi:hypothetical protein Scep_031064 [Stephania cephalantha]|uniref:Uncharacterized protein n=1 Tax=Stephania cephalantha TaxID=152367 RepID=A0AAP0E1E2_9MAGN